MLDAVGVELAHVAVPLLRGRGNRQHLARANLIADTGHEPTNRRIRHLFATVDPSANHPDNNPGELTVSTDADALERCGITIESATARWYTSPKTGREVVKVTATMLLAVPACLWAAPLDQHAVPLTSTVFNRVGPAGEPVTDTWCTCSVEIEVDTEPARVVLVPVLEENGWPI